MIYIRLRSRQPLCVGADPAQGFIRRTLPYIPGSALRGALASQLRSREPSLSPTEFQHYMLGPGTLFQNLYPLPEQVTTSYPLPITAYSCKHHTGFVHDRGNSSHSTVHGVRDILFENLQFLLSHGSNRAQTVPSGKCDSTGCALPLEPFGGFYVGDSANSYRQIQLSRRRITQTAIDPNRETARPANLFTIEALEEDQLFAGYFALGNDDIEQYFCAEICRTGDEVRIGYGRTRGMGLMSVVDCTMEEPDPWVDSLEQRVGQFQARAATLALGQQGQLFSLTLLSDAIVLDPFFRHQSQIDGPTLAREVDERLGSAILSAAFARTHPIAGWSSPHGLPRPVDQAIAMGSTFVYASELPQAELIEVLQAIELIGIGERLNEGFGRVIVCHPFHQEVTQI